MSLILVIRSRRRLNLFSFHVTKDYWLIDYAKTSKDKIFRNISHIFYKECFQNNMFIIKWSRDCLQIFDHSFASVASTCTIKGWFKLITIVILTSMNANQHQSNVWQLQDRLLLHKLTTYIIHLAQDHKPVRENKLFLEIDIIN